MSIITDGLRSDKWRPFARQKLAMLKEMGLTAKNYVVDGYRISLFMLGDIAKARIAAPPAIVSIEIQYSPETPFNGAQMLYYSEPYGAAAYPVGPMGVSGDGIHDVLLTSSDAIHYDAPGYGVIFPSPSDFYHASMGFWEQLPSPFSIAGLDVRYANYAAKTLSPPDALIASGSYTNSVGSWQTCVGEHIFSVGFLADGANAEYFRIFAYGLDYRADLLFDMDSMEVQTALGLMTAYPGEGRHMSARAVYVYPHGASARVAVFAAPLDYLDALGGVYFFDFTLNAEDSAHPAKWLGWTYAGRCLTGELGGAWVTDTALGLGCGPVYSPGQQDYKSCIFQDGAGGVISIIRKPTGDAGLVDGVYTFSPAGAVRESGAGASFPPEIADPQTWPVIFRGEDGAHLCLMEKIADNGPATDPVCEIVAVYGGAPSAWASLPMPTGELLAVRPIRVSAARTALLGLVWVGSASGTHAAQFDSDAGWRVMGKVSDARMRRPVVGLFGDHEFSNMAQSFPGSFPVTSLVGTHAYTGG